MQLLKYILIAIILFIFVVLGIFFPVLTGLTTVLLWLILSYNFLGVSVLFLRAQGSSSVS